MDRTLITYSLETERLRTECVSSVSNHVAVSLSAQEPRAQLWGQAGRSINGEKVLGGVILLCACYPAPVLVKGHVQIWGSERWTLTGAFREDAPVVPQQGAPTPGELRM